MHGQKLPGQRAHSFSSSLLGDLTFVSRLCQPSWLHESFGVMNFLADERYRLYDCFDRADLAEMLRRFRASALEILAFS